MMIKKSENKTNQAKHTIIIIILTYILLIILFFDTRINRIQIRRKNNNRIVTILHYDMRFISPIDNIL